MRDWLSENLAARAHRDMVHETARKAAEARAAQTARDDGTEPERDARIAAYERLKAVSPPGVWA